MYDPLPPWWAGRTELHTRGPTCGSLSPLELFTPKSKLSRDRKITKADELYCALLLVALCEDVVLSVPSIFILRIKNEDGRD